MNFGEEQRQPRKSGSSLPRLFRAIAPKGLKISGLIVSRPSVVEFGLSLLLSPPLLVLVLPRLRLCCAQSAAYTLF